MNPCHSVYIPQAKMIFQDDRIDYVDSSRIKNVMPCGSQSTNKALKFVSDIDFWILVRLGNNNMKDQFLMVLTQSVEFKGCKMEKILNRNRILITLQFDQKIIDISIIPDSSPSELTSTRIVLVQGYILKKMLKEYLSQLNKEEKLQFETTVVLLKLSKFLNNLDGIPGYLLELVTLFCIISDKPRSILAVFFAINMTLKNESTKLLCFSFSDQQPTRGF